MIIMKRKTSRKSLLLLVGLIVVVVLESMSFVSGFATPLRHSVSSSSFSSAGTPSGRIGGASGGSTAVATFTTSTTNSRLFVFGKNKNHNKSRKKDDLSAIETRDMTPDEMRALNRKNEDIMNAELTGMTLFSLILSIPMLYLVWVGFFSETAGVVEDALPY